MPFSAKNRTVPKIAVGRLLRVALPDEGFGPPILGIETFETALRVCRHDRALERPPFLHLGHAAPAGLTVSRNGLWSVQDYAGRNDHPAVDDFNLIFETAFCVFVDQVLLVWANDLAGAPLRAHELKFAQGARLADLPPEVQKALAHLVAPRALSPRTWGDVQPIDNPDLLQATRRAEEAPAEPLGSHIVVVGLPYAGHPEIVARIGPGDLLRLHPADDNPHDSHAVEVWHDGEISIRVGFVERKDAPNIRRLPPDPAAWRLRVTDRSDRVLVAALELARSDADQTSRSPGPTQEGGLPEQAQDLFSPKRGEE